MDRHRDSDGFTAVEMMLTLMIVSILLLVAVIHMPKFDDSRSSDEILNIGYLFQGAQTSAISSKTPHIVEIDHSNNRINVKNNKGVNVNQYTLNSCKLKRGGLDRFIYRQNGDTSAFGTLRMTCSNKEISFVFQINNGRFRVEQ